MKYTILEIMPGQIKVEYEDKSWAIVPVHPNATTEDIDYEVSKYDPDFTNKPENLINKNISIGDKRTSILKKSVTATVNSVNTTSVPNIPNTSDFAGYFARKGDTRLQDAIDTRIENYILHSSFSLDKLISDVINAKTSNFKLTNEIDIFAQAEAELQSESQN